MKYLDDKITEIYCDLDEFCIAFTQFLQSKSLGNKPVTAP
jgi:hypothetical protein